MSEPDLTTCTTDETRSVLGMVLRWFRAHVASSDWMLNLGPIQPLETSNMEVCKMLLGWSKLPKLTKR